jgi:acetyltransferase-like isoleucine patch superfamily enzyme
VVVHPVPKYSIVAGNPAKIIKSRLDGQKASGDETREDAVS